MLLYNISHLFSNCSYLEKPFSFHHLRVSWDAFSPAFGALQILLAGERVASVISSEIPFSDERGKSSVLTDEDTCSCTNQQSNKIDESKTKLLQAIRKKHSHLTGFPCHVHFDAGQFAEKFHSDIDSDQSEKPAQFYTKEILKYHHKSLWY